MEFRIKKQKIDKQNLGFRLLKLINPISHILNPLFYPRGIASLPTVIVLGVVILAISVSIATVSFSELFISQGSAQSSKALFYAEAGARDALVKISRNKHYICTSTDCYTIEFVTNGCGPTLDGCAKVSVNAGVGTIGDPKVITSKGLMQLSSRTINVSVILDSSSDGTIATTTWSENTN